MGRIYSAIREFHPAGATCRCPCNGGMATDMESDALIVAGCSNWGAYGVAAMLAYLLEKPELFHSAVEEEFMLRQMAIAGANDAFTGESQPSVDNIHLQAHLGLNHIMHEIIENALSD
ncbi:glutamate cyclase domain-containing protein [Hahella sp. CCB-MM4]|uniref:glutamate cyclase domain-containing protein n=1 Tax=Hahella sp. (strain CCB-MM4) TaxID=1926491 RepID=UPI001FEF3B4C|nr:glutamate cyclase domain-containing protein [Hahella sp. CCB-MM4]